MGERTLAALARTVKLQWVAGQAKLVSEGRALLTAGKSGLASAKARLVAGGAPAAPAAPERVSAALSTAEVRERLAAEKGHAAPPRRRPPVATRHAPPGGMRAALHVVSLLAVAVVPGAAMVAGAITVVADTYCTYGSFCLYSGPNFDGRKVEYTRDQMFCQYSQPPLDVPSVLPEGARSVVNNTRTTTDGLGVKIYSSTGNLVLTTISPGGEVSELDGATAKAMQTLCAYPKR